MRINLFALIRDEKLFHRLDCSRKVQEAAEEMTPAALLVTAFDQWQKIPSSMYVLTRI